MNKQAVVLTGGKQYFVKEGETLVVDRLEGKVKDQIQLGEVLMLIGGEKMELGQPYLKNKVTAEIVKQDRGEKIRVARFKAKSKYRKVRGFRQELTQVKIVSIS